MTTEELYREALEKLAKWRSVYAGWRLGTRLSNDGESKYTRDLHEQILILRADCSALAFLVRDALVATGMSEAAAHEKLQERMLQEVTELDRLQSLKFPGMSSTPDGISYKLPEARDTMTRLGFAP